MGILKRNGALVKPPENLRKNIETDSSKLRATYLTIANNGYTLKDIVVTHPDTDHYKGIQKLVNHDINCPGILLTDRFLGGAIINGENKKNEVEIFFGNTRAKKLFWKACRI